MDCIEENTARFWTASQTRVPVCKSGKVPKQSDKPFRSVKRCANFQLLLREALEQYWEMSFTPEALYDVWGESAPNKGGVMRAILTSFRTSWATRFTIGCQNTCGLSIGLLSHSDAQFINCFNILQFVHKNVSGRIKINDARGIVWGNNSHY